MKTSGHPPLQQCASGINVPLAGDKANEGEND